MSGTRPLPHRGRRRRDLHRLRPAAPGRLHHSGEDTDHPRGPVRRRPGRHRPPGRGGEPGRRRARLLARTASVVHGTDGGRQRHDSDDGAPTGLLVTEGFRDEIEMRRCYKEDIWDPSYPAPEPIARRRVRLEIDERITSEGTVDRPLDEGRRAQGDGETAGLRRHVDRRLLPPQLPQPGATSCAPREIISTSIPTSSSFRSPTRCGRSRPSSSGRPPPSSTPSWARPSCATSTGWSRGCGRPASRRSCSSPPAPAAWRLRGRRKTRPLATISSGPTGGVVAAALPRGRGGSRRRGQRGHGRHELRRLPDPRRPAGGEDGLELAAPLLHRAADGRRALHRSRRRLAQPQPLPARSPSGPSRPAASRARCATARGGTEPTVTDADLVLGRLDPGAFWSGRLDLDVDGARRALATVGKPLGLDVEETAVATAAIIDAHMCDAVRRILSLAGVDAARARPGRIRRDGRRARRSPRRAARHAPRAHPAAPRRPSPRSACSRPITSSTRRARCRGTGAPSTSARLSELADDLLASAEDALEVAGIPPERRVYEWRINLVYPGQTFDVAIPIDKAPGAPISQDAAGGRGERVPSPQRGGPPHRSPVAGAGRCAVSGCWPPDWSDQPAELVLDGAPAAEPHRPPARVHRGRLARRRPGLRR